MRRLLVHLAVAIAMLLLPGSGQAVGFSLDQVVANQLASAELGSGRGGADDCSTRVGATFTSSGPCHAEDQISGQRSAGVPTYNGTFAGVSLGPGTNRVYADADGELHLEPASADRVDFHGPGTFLVGSMGGTVTINDSTSDQPDHPSAAAAITLDEFFDITVPTDPFFLRLHMLSTSSQYGVTHEALFTVVELATGDTLLSRSEKTFEWEEFDLSAYAGSQLRFSFQADLSIAGPENFRTSDDFPFGRFFSEHHRAALAFRQVPEPGSLALLGCGLALLALRARPPR